MIEVPTKSLEELGLKGPYPKVNPRHIQYDKAKSELINFLSDLKRKHDLTSAEYSALLCGEASVFNHQLVSIERRDADITPLVTVEPDLTTTPVAPEPSKPKTIYVKCHLCKKNFEFGLPSDPANHPKKYSTKCPHCSEPVVIEPRL